VLFHFPFGGDLGDFTMENIARAGGLTNSLPNTLRVEQRTANDVIIVGPRSWEQGGEFLRTELANARKDGWLIVVFGSKQGMPADLPFDILIDNGAASGAEGEAALNQIVNVTNGWVWSSELTAALTRLGWYPGILRGMPVPGSQELNKIYQTNDPKLYPCATPIAPGVLAKQYLDGIDKMLDELEGRKSRKQIARAADFAAECLRSGHTVWASSFTHVLDGEVLVDNKSPIKGFRGISCGDHGESFTQNLKEGDLLFFFGEWSLNLPWTDYLAYIRSTHCQFIPGVRICTEPMEKWEGKADFYDYKVSDALMVLEQHWPFENAVVSIPFPPGKMAPVSGVYVCLQYRMLDEQLAHCATQ